jgi:hypothetical protein
MITASNSSVRGMVNHTSSFAREMPGSIVSVGRPGGNSRPVCVVTVLRACRLHADTSTATSFGLLDITQDCVYLPAFSRHTFCHQLQPAIFRRGII